MALSGHRGAVTIYEADLIDSIGPLTFLKPLTVVVEVTQGRVVIADDVFLRYGVGTTPDEALASYVADLIQYYEAVEKSAAIYPEDARLLQAMRDTFVFRAEPWHPA
jgi:hypothetical protein